MESILLTSMLCLVAHLLSFIASNMLLHCYYQICRHLLLGRIITQPLLCAHSSYYFLAVTSFLLNVTRLFWGVDSEKYAHTIFSNVCTSVLFFSILGLFGHMIKTIQSKLWFPIDPGVISRDSYQVDPTVLRTISMIISSWYSKTWNIVNHCLFFNCISFILISVTFFHITNPEPSVNHKKK